MDITQALLDKLFSQLRIIHKAHWKAPKVEEVTREIKEKGEFVFRIGKEPHVAEVIISEKGVFYEINAELPERMRKQAEEMKRQFNMDNTFK